MEILHREVLRSAQIRAAVFDFDGTISTLRQGWEQVMFPLMCEMIDPDSVLPEIPGLVSRYIDESTGIQTIYQMQWLRDRVIEYGKNPGVHDEWWYKDEYNRRLMDQVNRRIDALKAGECVPGDFLIQGSEAFVRRLAENGVELYVASGTDDADVAHEVETLGLKQYFTGVAGAPHRKAECSKELVIRNLLEDKGLEGKSLLIAGDGKVEIRLGKNAGALTLGAATDEVKRGGVNPIKRQRLIDAGADMIVGDFSETDKLIEQLGLK